jgi:choline kinase
MGGLTADRPKCLVNINEEETILSVQLRTLLKSGVDEIVITTGYKASLIAAYIKEHFPDTNVTFVHNELYNKTNYIYSVYLCNGLLEDDVLMLHGDLFFNETVLCGLLGCETSAAVVDSTQPLPEKDFKAAVADGRVTEISIKPRGRNLVALQPLYLLKKKDWLTWQDKIKEFCLNGSTDVYAENALKCVSDRLDIRPFDINGDLCMEVDTIDDLELLKTKLRT